MKKKKDLLMLGQTSLGADALRQRSPPGARGDLEALFLVHSAIRDHSGLNLTLMQTHVVLEVMHLLFRNPVKLSPCRPFMKDLEK